MTADGPADRQDRDIPVWRGNGSSEACDVLKGKTFWLASVLILGLGGLLVGVFGVSTPTGEDGDVPATAAPRDVWVVEDGVMAWRPMTTGEKAAVAIFSLGLALNEPFVQGRKMRGADVSSFRGLSPDYGVDKRAVWFRGLVLEGAGRDSFRVADHGFGWDDGAIWRGDVRIMANPAPGADLIALSPTIYMLGARGYYLDQVMDEPPLTAPASHCRGWHVTNGALWLEARRLAAMGEEARVLSCDGAKTTRDGVEDISRNAGILIADGPLLLRFRRDGGQEEVARFDAEIAQAEITHLDLLFLQLKTGEVLALDPLRPERGVQGLGARAPLDMKRALAREGEVWLDDSVWFRSPGEDQGQGPFLREVGTDGEVLGDYLRLGGRIYKWGRPLATPGDLPVTPLGPSRIMIGDMCVSFGQYVTDLPEDFTERQGVERCDVHRPPNPILYAGLEIGFREGFIRRGGADAEGLFPYHLGEVFLRNAGVEAVQVDAAFVRSIDFRAFGEADWVTVDVERPRATAGRYRLAPGATLSWPVEVRGPEGAPPIGYVLEANHLPERAAIFGTARFQIGHGQAPSSY